MYERLRQIALKYLRHIAIQATTRKEGDREDWTHTPTAHDALTNAYPSIYAPRTLDEVLTSATSPNTYPATCRPDILPAMIDTSTKPRKPPDANG